MPCGICAMPSLPDQPPDPQAATILIEVIRLGLTAILSALLSGLWIRHWQYREDFIEKRLDDLIREVDGAADLACAYWMRDADAAKEPRDDAIEADLIARQTRIGSLRSLVSDFFDSHSGMNLQLSEANFIRALTGGDFGSSSRKYEAMRLRDIRAQAANYIGELRRARRSRLDASWWTRIRH